MVLLKQVSGSVLWKSCHKKFPKINSKTPVLKYLFKKFANLRSAALLKRDSSTSFFSRILRDFWNTYFVFDYRVLCKKVVLKSSTLFTAKFMWTAASGISENIVTRNSDYGDFLVTMVRIGLVWPAANLLRYWVFSLRCSLQLILHWWAPNQCSKVDNSTQMITEVDLDTQAAAKGNPGT